ncbi:protein SSUH2 homolog [Chanos chanos]|uniref:Protein SSUH2 homolog n=1 Tax=Chanos chanos TaxID=29144 RepID=A0A6J2UPH2_CHACN|nr:protein SSUH2 homolog [Chanos chanos]
MTEDAAFRSDLVLMPSQYTTIPPARETKRHMTHQSKASAEVYHPVTLPNLTETGIREALLTWVKTNPFLPPIAAREMLFTAVNHEMAYIYKLESFTEQRSVCVRFEPCLTTAPLASSEGRREPQPWKVKVTPAKMFTNQVYNYRLMHTDSHSSCRLCQGEKWLPCDRCSGSARVRCSSCRGRGSSGRLWPRACSRCQGQRLMPCPFCMSLGQVCCEMCLGYGRLCFFKELRVEFRAHAQSRLQGGCSIPDKKLLRAAGEVLHSSVAETVPPLMTFPVSEVNAASRQLMEECHGLWPDCRIIQQRHLLKAVPIAHVQYTWRNSYGNFYVYGAERAVYFPNYPRPKICWCCL